MTTHCQATLQAATSSHRRSSAVVVDQFRSFSACCASAALSHSQSSQHTPTPVPQSASAQATVLQTLTQPQTPSNPGNPGDPWDDNPDDGDNPFIGDDDKGEDDLQGNELTMLARAIQNLTHTSRRNLDNDQTKVTFAQSYLKGMVLQWFEPDLLSDSDPNNHPLWMDNWKEFIIELQITFRPHDPVTDAEHELDHLQMKESQHINNLPDRIKDEICHVGKPWTLGELHLLAQEVDAHYWECKEEIQFLQHIECTVGSPQQAYSTHLLAKY
ncbi:hypothetical protein ID866_12518 [Astraeus odoratus]|nr:hypothetical protein ID866_12518 [Astraeus odoratus]